MLFATGIVAEYNPFHNGHLYHLREAKLLTGQPVIVVMSGSLMQRGEPACLDKWQRAALAAANGADLVLELPAAFSLRSAQYFAEGAIALLEATGCVNALVCGAESPELDFPALAQAITSDEAQESLRAHLAQGLSYAAACAAVLTHAAGAAATLDKPNDILALEYCKALRHTALAPHFVRRSDAGYNSTGIDGGNASASAIRRELASGGAAWQDAVPPNVRAALLATHAGYDAALLWQLLRYRLRLLSAAEIASRCETGEGLENLLKQAEDADDLNAALAICAKKRYSAGRIRRLLLQLALDLPRTAFAQAAPAYLRVLAFNNTGRKLLKQMQTCAALPLVTKLGRNCAAGQNAAFAEQIALEYRATDLWSMVQYDARLNRAHNDLLISPVYVK